MYPDRFPSHVMPATDASANPAQTGKLSPADVNRLHERASNLLMSFEKLEQADVLLREARELAVKADCHGILYRMDKYIEKFRLLRANMMARRRNIMRHVNNGN